MRYKFIFATMALLACSSVARCESVELLAFSQPSCPPCQRMQPVIEQLAKEGYSVRRVDLASNRALATQHKVDGTPTLIILRDGRESKRFVGITSKAELVSQLQPKIKSMPLPESKSIVTVRLGEPVGIEATTVVQPAWVEVPLLRKINPPVCVLYDDILGRTPVRQKWYGDYATTAHEVNHLVNNRICDGMHWAYYVGDGRAAIFPSPRITMSDVANVVPQSMRKEMYELYVIQNAGTNESMPMVLLDEWTTFYNEVRLQVELIHRYPKDRRVQVAECLSEMCVVGLAVHDAIKQRDPAYLEKNPDFGYFVTWLLSESLATYDGAMRFDRFKWQAPFMTRGVRSYLESRLAKL